MLEWLRQLLRDRVDSVPVRPVQQALVSNQSQLVANTVLSMDNLMQAAQQAALYGSGAHRVNNSFEQQAQTSMAQAMSQNIRSLEQQMYAYQDSFMYSGSIWNSDPVVLGPEHGITYISTPTNPEWLPTTISTDWFATYQPDYEAWQKHAEYSQISACYDKQ